VKILFLSAWLPYPPINGAKIRIYNLVRQLSKKHEITLLSFAQTIPIEKAIESVPVLEKYCRSVKIVQAQTFKPSGFRTYKGFLSTVPRSVYQTYSDEMAELIRDTLHHNSFDVIVASEVYAPSLVSLLISDIQGIPKILDAIEIALAMDAYKSQKRVLSRVRNGLTWIKLRQFTKNMLRKSTACTVPSSEEKKNIISLVDERYPVEIIPHSLDLDQYKESYELAEPNTLVFTGSFTYHANLDAVRYFSNDIFPEIRKQLPPARLKVIGNLNGIEPEDIHGYDAMTFTGLIQDVRPEVARSWLSIVPLRVGAGTRLKIIESMALGTPVISTSKGAEGLDVSHGKNILIADTPDEFIQAVLNVMRSSELRKRLSDGGRALVAEKYNSEVIGEKFNEFMEYVVNSSRNDKHL